MTDIRAAAQRWAAEWKRGWDAEDADGLIALYADDVAYWSEPFREPFVGREALHRYFVEAFEVEDSISSWFGEPVVDGDRAAVAWWGRMNEEGSPTTIVGISLLRFNEDGLVTSQVDGWNQAEGMRPHPEGWG